MTEVVPPDDFRGYGLFALCADIKWSIQTFSRFCDKRYLISNSLVRLLAFYSVRCFNGLSKQETQFREWSVESLIQRQEKER